MSDDDDKDLYANLAFMKTLVSEGGRAQMSGGAAFLAAGVCYGAQCFLQWAALVKILPLSGLGHLLVGLLPTVVFLIVLSIFLWRDRKTSQSGVATRALNAAFGSAGLANLFMVAVFAYVAITEKSMLIWMLYPITICAFQGSVWYIAYMIRKQWWLAAVSLGWFVTAVALGLLIRTPHYVLVLAFALTGLMGGSGWYMMKQARK